ncbi:Uncharacterized HTH-type transcriptional regulator yegW [Raoultella terrigena]|uniref:Uncharacterized HTH-type transcriptional regulator yegW n=1 Tax=Raoultella terrigena TaxID=577 RepID=A0A4U9D3M3_RAOTE|nr:Uncharacterized HTH-type transcriptional regulator yegW [Raoultella terrigena]
MRSGWLENGNILPGERDLSQLTGVSRITVRKALRMLEDEGVVTRAQGYGTRVNNIFEYSLKEARGFTQQVVLRGKSPTPCGSTSGSSNARRRSRSSWRLPPAATCLCSSAFATWMTRR